MNTIKKSTVLEADKLATIYASELRGLGYTPSNTLAVTSEKLMRLEFQNGELNKITFPIGRLVNWVKTFADDAEVEMSFDPRKGEDGSALAVKMNVGGSFIKFLHNPDEKDQRALTEVPAIRFDDDNHTRQDFRLLVPVETGDLKAKIASQKAAAKFAKLRNVELKAKSDLKAIAGEHRRNLEILAAGIAPAIAQARLIVKARRMLRAALKNPMAAIPWLGDTVETSGADTVTHFESGEHWDLVAAIHSAKASLAAYVPRQKKEKSWDGKLTGKTTPIYGPAYTALQSAVKSAQENLNRFIVREFAAQIKQNGLPEYVGTGGKMHLHYAIMLRTYSRARIAVRRFADKKTPFIAAYADALKARRKAQPELAAKGGVITARAILSTGEKLEVCTLSTDVFESSLETAQKQGASVEVIESQNALYPVGIIAPKVEPAEPVNETHADLEKCLSAAHAVDDASRMPEPVADDTTDEQRPARVDVIARECSIVAHPTKPYWFMVIEAGDTRGTVGETLRAAGNREHCEKWLAKIQAEQAERKAIASTPASAKVEPAAVEPEPVAVREISCDKCGRVMETDGLGD